MPWESRKGTDNKYYTRSRRVGGKVVRDYCGRGWAGELAAALDELRHIDREIQHHQHRQEIEEVAANDEAVEEIMMLSDLLVEAELLRAGYHKHKGEWRKRRGDRRD